MHPLIFVQGRGTLLFNKLLVLCVLTCSFNVSVFRLETVRKISLPLSKWRVKTCPQRLGLYIEIVLYELLEHMQLDKYLVTYVGVVR